MQKATAFFSLLLRQRLCVFDELIVVLIGWLVLVIQIRIFVVLSPFRDIFEFGHMHRDVDAKEYSRKERI